MFSGGFLRWMPMFIKNVPFSSNWKAIVCEVSTHFVLSGCLDVIGGGVCTYEK